jgi:DNA-binding IclR family transcriptional regulator
MPLSHCPPPRSVIGRITAILSTFRTGTGHSVTEIARLTGLPLSTTYRLTTDLAAWQVLHRDPDGVFGVGSALRGLDDRTWCLPTLQDRAPQVLADLSEATRQRTRLGVLSEGRVAYAEKRAGPEPVMPFRAGVTLPAHATAVGKALLAFAPQATVAAAAQHLTAHTPQTLTSPERLHRALRGIRVSKLAISRGELVAGEFAIAVPVSAPGGDVVAALEVEVADQGGDVQVCRAALVVAAGALAREMAGAALADRPRLRIVASPYDPALAPVRSASGS